MMVDARRSSLDCAEVGSSGDGTVGTPVATMCDSGTDICSHDVTVVSLVSSRVMYQYQYQYQYQ